LLLMIIDHTDLTKLRKDNANKKIVFCDGTFDLLHPAHAEHLKSLRAYGDVLVVGVMSDVWVKMRKGEGRPIMDQTERLALVDAIRYVDYTVLLYDAASGRVCYDRCVLEPQS
jgi:D-beta-D-heptose 7-phosphate kinase/D-beta-D-heptose 1-phosphate adenosyltransferase